MRVLNNIRQGSNEWHAARKTRFCASEAAAALGVSKHTTRSELLRLKSGGEPAEVGAHKQALFDRGHEAEATARVIAEELLGDELYPCTVVSDDGLYLASLDGLTDDGQTIWEHKLYSADLAGMVNGDSLSPEYLAQIDHQMMVTGAQKCVLMVSDGTRDFCCWMWVDRDEARIAALRAGWDQFALDLANYVHREADPVVVGVSPESLPVLRLQMAGDVALSNLPEFRARAEAIFGAINLSVADDQSLADAKAAVEYCAETEKRIGEVRAKATAQPESLSQSLAEMEAIKQEFPRRVRLILENEIKDYEAARRRAIIAEGETPLAEHLAKLAERLGIARFPGWWTTDFVAAVKGKRSTVAMRDAVATTLARAKIAANELADRMQKNLKALRGSDHASLFPDAEALATQPPHDVAAIMFSRIAQAKDEADKRAEESRERIRREEEAKARKAEADKRALEQMDHAAANIDRWEEVQRRTGIRSEIAEALATEGHISAVTAKRLVEAIIAGRIPYLQINYEVAK